VRRELVLLCAALGFSAHPLRAENSGLIQQGRRVYIAEGCIHCHSQYVRPGTSDEERWGAAHALPELERQRPPLFGNRRQGPDLQNVGSRRPAEWLRTQLQTPRTIMAGSRMPSYAHLFRAGRTEGDALVAYLESLKEPAP
jgi:cbb3-type cytochrome c oxidase subunit II